jgi:hypothetical protein
LPIRLTELLLEIAFLAPDNAVMHDDDQRDQHDNACPYRKSDPDVLDLARGQILGREEDPVSGEPIDTADEDHLMKCPACGGRIDMRDLGASRAAAASCGGLKPIKLAADLRRPLVKENSKSEVPRALKSEIASTDLKKLDLAAELARRASVTPWVELTGEEAERLLAGEDQ